MWVILLSPPLRLGSPLVWRALAAALPAEARQVGTAPGTGERAASGPAMQRPVPQLAPLGGAPIRMILTRALDAVAGAGGACPPSTGRVRAGRYPPPQSTAPMS